MPSKPHLDHFSCMAARETLLPSIQKEKSRLKVSWPTCRLQKACDFARVQAGDRAGLSCWEYYTIVEHEVHTPDSWLRFAIAKPVPRVFAVRSCSLCPLPGPHWSNTASPVVSAPSCPAPALWLPSLPPSPAAVLLREQNPSLWQAVKWQLAVSISFATQKHQVHSDSWSICFNKTIKKRRITQLFLDTNDFLLRVQVPICIRTKCQIYWNI